MRKLIRNRQCKINPLIDCLHIFVLSSFGISQPLFDVLSKNTGFFVAHSISPAHLILVVFIILTAIPLSIISIEFFIRLLSQQIYKLLHGLMIFMLILLIVLPPLKKIDCLPDIAMSISAAVISFGCLCVYLRFNRIRQFITALSPAIIIFPVLFLCNSQISSLVFPKAVNLFEIEKTGSYPPIIMIIFDEFPVASLMDENKQIDAVRYPNFAKLAKNAHWFRNATTVHANTQHSIPATLSGLSPDVKKIPTLENYPRNLFTLLGSVYELNAMEQITTLCPKKLNLKQKQLRLTSSLAPLLMDIGTIYLHLVLPDTFSRTIPDVRGKWKGFNFVLLNKHNWLKDRINHFEEFIDAIKVSDKPALYMTHVILPHVPWEYYPSGKKYNCLYPNIGSLGHDWQTLDPVVIKQAYQRHLLQVGTCDMLLGKLMAHLKKLSLFDKTMIIITADHGCSFMPEEPRRGVSKNNFSDIICIPLLIKAPHQKTGFISDKNVETIDILPTIADILHIDLPWQVNGQSALDSSLPERKEKTLFAGSFESFFMKELYHSDITEKYNSLLLKIKTFGSGNNRPNGLYSLGLQHYNLIGKNLDHFNIIEDKTLAIQIDNSYLFNNINDTSRLSDIRGRIAPGFFNTEKTVWLAVTVNDVIQGVTQAYTSTELKNRFSCLVSDKAFKNGKNKIKVFSIATDKDNRLTLSRPSH